MADDGVAWRIRLARKGRGWTQAELAEKFGLERHSATQFETGRGISRERLTELAHVLGVSFPFLSAGIAQESDIDVIVEGARQEGWDQAVERMREQLASMSTARAIAKGRKARPSRSDEDVVLPHPPPARKKKGA